MLVRLLTRSGLLSGFASAAWLSIVADVPEAPLNNNRKFETSSVVTPKELKSVADVEIFAKLKGCKFIFLDKSQKKGYEGTEFVETKLKEKKGSLKHIEKGRYLVVLTI